MKQEIKNFQTLHSLLVPTNNLSYYQKNYFFFRILFLFFFKKNSFLFSRFFFNKGFDRFRISAIVTNLKFLIFQGRIKKRRLRSKKITLKWFRFFRRRRKLYKNNRGFSKYIFLRRKIKFLLRLFRRKIKPKFLILKKKNLLKNKQTSVVVKNSPCLINKFVVENFSKKTISSIRSSLKFKSFFFGSIFKRFDPIFFSYIFNKFLNRFMLQGKKRIAERLIFSIFLPLKFFLNIKSSFLFFSMVESSRPFITNIPKNLAGKLHIVPSFLFFDKQFKLSLRSISRLVRRKQDFLNVNSSSTSVVRSRRIIKMSMLLLRTHKIYFARVGKYTQRRNFIFDILKKNYYLFVSNRTYIQFRWR